MSELPEDEDVPSRSARKRAAEAAQRLGEQLVRLTAAELAGLPLPAPVLEAVREAQRITSRAAAVRQRQYIGRLMRGIDTQQIREAMEQRDQRHGQHTEQLKRIERWRARLIAQGEPALAALLERYPQLDRARLEAVLARARTPQHSDAAQTAAARELFRMLRELFEGVAPD
jgi:ribosome-associated protein